MAQAISEITRQSLTLFEPSKGQADSLSAIISRSGLPSDVGSAVQASISGATIRSGLQEDIVMFSTALSSELEFVARTYTGCVNTSEMVWDEAMDFVVTRYGNLNIKEILYAFRLAASGELGDVNLRAYFGTFTVGMLGEVLTAYMERRQQIYRELRRLESDTELVAIGPVSSRHNVEQWKQNRVKLLKMLESPTVEDVTAYDYEFLSEMGLVVYSPDEKRLIFDMARPLVVRDLSNEANRSGTFRAREIGKMIENANNGNPSDAFIARQKSMAQRLAVVQWLKSLKSNND